MSNNESRSPSWHEKRQAESLHSSIRGFFERHGSKEISLPLALGSIVVGAVVGLETYRLLVKVRSHTAAKHLNLRPDVKDLIVEVAKDKIEYQPADALAQTKTTPMDFAQQVDRVLHQATGGD